MKAKTVKQRAFYYLLLGIFCVVIPYLVTILAIIATGDRETGMGLAVIPSLVVIHFVFAILFLKVKPLIRYSLPLLTAFICIIGLKFLLPLRLIETNFDIYGYWDIALTHFIIAVIIWELTYQVLNKLNLQHA